MRRRAARRIASQLRRLRGAPVPDGRDSVSGSRVAHAR
ncbi:hypothetical protein BDSB_14935 [Burkholderia dolosa PC543]|nr:hypothetical protein BDSB_14935 [Burkholderia dolosa PC543]